MNGSSARPGSLWAAIGHVVMAGCLAALLAGCAKSRMYDGKLAPGMSRLTVENRTPWSCEVTVTPEGSGGDRFTDVRAFLDPRDRYDWDLVPGRYQLRARKAVPPVKGFSQPYEARPNVDAVWPLLDLTQHRRP